MTIDEAINHLQTHSTTNGSGMTTDKQHEEAKIIAIEALEQRMWVPVHERLPEKNGNYLVTYESFDGTARLRYEDVDHYGPDWLHESKHTKVVAWMSLPEAYNAESEIKDDNCAGNDQNA